MVAPIRVYFDASGSDVHSRVWTVGGWIGTAADWNGFNVLWQLMLDEAPFAERVTKNKRVFHAADLEYRQGIYLGWMKEQQQAFQNRAYDVIRQFPRLTAVSCSVIKTDWKESGVILETIPEEHPGNYFVSAIFEALSNVRKWADEQNYKGRILYTFESGDIGRHHAESALRAIKKNPERRARHRVEDFAFVGKHVLPLQAADLWAYEISKHMLNRIIDGKIRNRRYPLERLWRDEYRSYNSYQDKERIASLLETGNRILEERKH